MKTFKAGQLSNNSGPVFEAAREEGAIIQFCARNGKVEREFVLINNDLINDIENLVFYSDFVSEILIENGYHGKAEALTERYMKVAHRLNLEQ